MKDSESKTYADSSQYSEKTQNILQSERIKESANQQGAILPDKNIFEREAFTIFNNQMTFSGQIPEDVFVKLIQADRRLQWARNFLALAYLGLFIGLILLIVYKVLGTIIILVGVALVILTLKIRRSTITKIKLLAKRQPTS